MTIRNLTARVFSRDGIVTKLVGHERPTEFREHQSEFALVYAESLMKPYTIKAIQAETGIGKTRGYLVPMMFSICESGEQGPMRKRGLIATHTRALRNQIISIDAPIAASMVDMAYGAPQNLKIALRTSLSSVASLYRAHKLVEDFQFNRARDLPFDEKRMSLAIDYLLFVRERFDMAKALFESGAPLDDIAAAVPQLSDWAEQNDDFPFDVHGDRLPDYSLTSEERSLRWPGEEAIITAIKPGIAAVMERNSASKDADIVITTHAMLLVDIATFGDILHSYVNQKRPEVRPFVATVIDEVDMMNDVALQFNDRKFTTQMMNEIACRFDPKTKRALDAIRKQFVATCTKQFHKSNVHSPSGPYEENAILDHLKEWSEIVSANLTNIIEDGASQTTQYHIDHVLATIGGLVMLIEDAGKSSRDSYLAEKTLTGMTIKRSAGTKDANIEIGMQPLYSGNLINRMWRLRAFVHEHILLTSATLRGSPIFEQQNAARLDVDLSKFNHFTSGAGIWCNKNNFDNIDPDVAVFRAFGHGRISRLVFANPANIDKADPKRSQISANPFDENSSGVFASPLYTDYVSQIIREAAERPLDGPANRTLVLIPSNDDKEALRAACGWLGNSLIVQALGAPGIGLKRRFAATQNGFWFGHNWHGFDFTDPDTGLTMIGRIIITRIPFFPAGDYRAQHHGGVVFAAAKDAAIARCVQGIGRGIRNPNDHPEVWFCDPRIGFPSLFTNRANAQNIYHRRSDRDFWEIAGRRPMGDLVPFRMYNTDTPMEIIDYDGRNTKFVSI